MPNVRLPAVLLTGLATLVAVAWAGAALPVTDMGLTASTHTVTAARHGALRDRRVTLRFTETNHGRDVMPDAQFITQATHGQVKSATATAGSCTIKDDNHPQGTDAYGNPWRDDTISCLMGRLAPGKSVHVVLRVAPLKGPQPRRATLVALAYVPQPGQDPNLTNNRAQARFSFR
jgi:hypothetical protein